MVHRRQQCRAVGAFFCLHLIQNGNGFAVENNKPAPAHWHVFRAANQLEENGLSTADNVSNGRRDDLTRQTVKILRQWGDKWTGEREMQTLLNKPELLHEIEESIIALAPFCDWLDSLATTQEGMEPITLVDVCAGKGILSMLASYVLQGRGGVKQIIMLDKANMNWNHIRTANDDAERDDRPPIITWSKCNIHEIDEVVGRLNNLDTPLALVGLHLCKTLSPTFLGISNRLGAATCPYVCLAPCCLPRAVAKPKRSTKENRSRKIDVMVYETEEQRQERNEALARRKAAMKRFSDCECFLCKSTSHRVQNCNLLPPDVDMQMDIFRKSAASMPCWRCGQAGHLKQECRSDQAAGKPSLVQPPHLRLDVSSVMESDRPFETYCELLSTALDRPRVRLEENCLVNNRQHADSNWNGGRKSTFIIGTM